MNDKYILNGHEVIVEPDLLKWGKWFQTADRHVKKETIGDVSISTVFLGLDHSYDEGEPILFETMVFGGKLDEEMDRCSTWDEAEQMHDKMCERVRQ